VIVRDITDPDGEFVGKVSVKSDLKELDARIRAYGTIVSGVTVGCFLFVLLLSVWLQRMISSPILTLAKTAEDVSRNEDYSLRAESQTGGEVGVLIHAFNDMLSRIQQRDSVLQEMTNQLAEANRTLERKVSARTSELARAKREAEEARDKALEASRAKSLFLANMSHEIRTPMNAIIGLSEIALRRGAAPEDRDFLARIRSSAQSLLGIINDILDFSKVEAGRLELELQRFDPYELFTDVADLLSGEAFGKGLELLLSMDPDIPHSLVGDPLRLRQVLLNLGSNAVKFTQEGEILLGAKLVSRDEERGSITFVVEDTGMGIEEAILPGLFDAFTQADATHSRRHEGTGLGLAISRRLVELMGGEIRVDSEVDRGSTFFFTLELPWLPEEQDQRLSLPAELRGIKVLVVDDNERSGRILTGILESLDIRTNHVLSGHEATRELEDAVQDEPYDLVLMDWRMPDMDGIETARKIDRDPRLARRTSKVIMATADDRDEILSTAKGDALDGLLVKPVTHSTLFDALLDAFKLEKPRSARVTDSRLGAPGSSSVSSLKGAHVLLVEDNPINQEIARRIMEEEGMVVTTADNGREAIDSARTRRFDAVLMDIQMPDMDGYEATRVIREELLQRELPIIAITAHAMKGDREKCLAAGLNDHVAKPIDVEALLSTMGRWIRVRLEAAQDAGQEDASKEKKR